MPEDKNREDAGKERLKEVKFAETSKENTEGAFAETPFGPSRKEEGTNVVRGVMKPIEERDFVGNGRSNGASVSGTKPIDDGYSEREKVWKTGENRKETDCPTGVCENAKETIQKPVNMNKGTGPATSKGPGLENNKGKNIQLGRLSQGNQWNMGKKVSSFFVGDTSKNGQSKKENLPNTTETGEGISRRMWGCQRGQQHDNIGVKGGKAGKSEGAEEGASGENENKKGKVREEDQEFKYVSVGGKKGECQREGPYEYEGYAKSAKEADKRRRA
nr:hypothetical protein Iba_chr14dCG12600 [Ipomoea batatas]